MESMEERERGNGLAIYNAFYILTIRVHAERENKGERESQTVKLS